MCRYVQECRKGFIKRIGSGSNTRILSDKWLIGEPIKLRDNVSLQDLGLELVQDLMIPDSKCWNSSLIWKTFSRDTTFEIISTHIPKEDFQHYYVWGESSSGEVEVKVREVYYFIL